MLIRSQDKKDLCNLDNVSKIYVYHNKEFFEYDIRCNECILGSYSTEAKAIKVLDMIEDEYLNANLTSTNNDFAYVSNRVFYMPTDEEVVV